MQFLKHLVKCFLHTNIFFSAFLFLPTYDIVLFNLNFLKDFFNLLKYLFSQNSLFFAVFSPHYRIMMYFICCSTYCQSSVVAFILKDLLTSDNVCMFQCTSPTFWDNHQNFKEYVLTWTAVHISTFWDSTFFWIVNAFW